MYLGPEIQGLKLHADITKRQNATTGLPSPGSTQSDQQSAQTWTYVVAAVVVVVFVGIGVLVLYSHLRQLKVAGHSPKYIPTSFLKRKWDAWTPKSKYSTVNRNGSTTESGIGLTAAGQTTETGVNRNTSVRSIMTLPAYSQKPKDNEEVLGREGERGGIDTVLELPETVDEEEERRETEMESLYQIRQARRREIAEREERRRERREARERGDFARLDELRRENRARREQNSLANLAQNSSSNVNLTAEALMAEHNSRGRDRRVSSVSYAQIGQVRHDGTRVRSNSHDSERSGLLTGAAPMGSHTRNGSEATLLSLGGAPQPRYRDRSNSAATSVTSTSSFENITPPSEGAQPSNSRNTNSPHRPTRSVSDIGAEEADIGTERMVVSVTDTDGTPHPPDYEGHDWGEAPEYTPSEHVTRANSTASARTAPEYPNRTPSTISRPDTLSIITPSINIEMPTGPNTPVSPITIHEQTISRSDSTR